MHLAIQALSLASLQACHWNKENTNVLYKRNLQSWKSQLAGGRTVGYLESVTEDLNSGPRNKSH